MSGRRVTAAALAVAVLAALAVVVGTSGSQAGQVTNTNACLSNVTAEYSDLPWTLGGTDTPDPATVGGNVTLSGGSVQADISAELLVSAYYLGLLSVGPNLIPTTVYVSRQASNATGVAPATGSGPAVQVDNFTVPVTTTIFDPDGTPATGDETATPLTVNQPLPNMVVTPTGGNIDWRQGPPGSLPLLPAGTAGLNEVQPNGSIFFTILIGGSDPGIPTLRANFDCFVGTTIVDPPGGASGPTYVPATPVPFETTTVSEPTSAPVCTGETVSVGTGQSTTIDLTDNCVDQDGNIDPTTYAVSALTPASPTGGTITPTATAGIYTYTAPGVDPGSVTFTFTVADTGGQVSNTATVTIGVEAPSGSAGGPYAGTEGGSTVIVGSASNPGSGPLTTVWAATPLSGTDPGAACTFADPNALVTTVSCSDDGVFTLDLAVSNGTATTTKSTTLTVANALPTVLIPDPPSPPTVIVGSQVVLDTGGWLPAGPPWFDDPGVNDSHTCTIDWGDGTVDAGVISSASFEYLGGEVWPTCTGTHTYAEIGLRTVTVNVTDDDGGVGTNSIQLYVEDPSATCPTPTDGDYLGSWAGPDPLGGAVAATLFFNSPIPGKVSGEIVFDEGTTVIGAGDPIDAWIVCDTIVGGTVAPPGFPSVLFDGTILPSGEITGTWEYQGSSGTWSAGPVGQSVSGEGTVTTDAEGDGEASPASPAETTVTSPVAGPVTIDTALSPGGSLYGFTLLPPVVGITAPTATDPADPLVLQFVLDAAILEGTPPSAIAVFRNGVLVEDCTVAGQAVPSPCVAERSTTPGGDALITVRTLEASVWSFGVPAGGTAPVCTSESVTAPTGQSTTIDLTDNCTDPDGNIDPSTYAVSVLTPASPTGGTLTPTATPGVYTYDAPATAPGPVTFTFTVADTDGQTSNTATVTIGVLADGCDATNSACGLDEIVVQPIIGATMTLAKAPGSIDMSPVTLDGNVQVTTGALRSLTVTTSRGTAAGWSMTAYVTDLGAPGAPTTQPLPGVTVPTCSLAGGGGTPDRLCIPGDNLGWSPTAQIVHDVIFGDVAQVNAGPSNAASAAGWLGQLVAAGVSGVNGLGGLGETNALCTAPPERSGGTFQCDAELWLGVPASAGAGTYTGGLVVTLV